MVKQKTTAARRVKRDPGRGQDPRRPPERERERRGPGRYAPGQPGPGLPGEGPEEPREIRTTDFIGTDPKDLPGSDDADPIRPPRGDADAARRAGGGEDLH